MDRVASWMAFAQRPREQGGLGLGLHGASGLVGNLVNESGPNLDPWGVTGDNGTAWGTAQWRGDRLSNLQNFARSQGLDHRSPEAQQAFMRHEFDNSEGKAWSALSGASSPEQAASAVNTLYERSADRTGNRERSARDLFARYSNPDGVNAINAAMGMQPSTGEGQAMGFAPQQPNAAPTQAPDDYFMGSLLSRMGSQGNGGGAPYDVGDAMAGAGASMMALDNARGAAVLAQMQQANRKNPNKMPEWQNDSKSGTFFRTKPDGTLEFLKNPNAEDGAGKAKLSESALKHVGETMEKYDYLNQSATNASDILNDIESGKLDLGAIKNMVNSGRNMAGMSDEQSRSYAKYNQFIQSLVNDNLRLNKGVQTEGDAYRELKSLASNGTMYDNETAKEALKRSISKSMEAVTKRGTSILDSHKAAYGDEPFAPYNDLVEGWKNNASSLAERLQKPAAPAAPAATAQAPASQWKVMGVRHP